MKISLACFTGALGCVLLGGCATVFDVAHRPLEAAEMDERISWWRMPDTSGRFEPPPVVVAEFNGADVLLPPADLLNRLRRGFAVPDLNTARVRQRQKWFADRPELVQRIVERSGPYLHFILEEIEKRKLPTEIALIPFIESGFDPEATSTAEAAGIWQFIPSTAIRYRLVLNSLRDERRDILASTRAALDYFEFLHATLGDWQLAFAAYNWGENAVLRAVERNRALGRSVHFEHLVLPEETRDYLPKLQAVKNILLSPDAFELVLPDMPNRPYFMAVPLLTADLKLADAARLAGMPLREFLLLNSGYTDRVIRRGQAVVVPLTRQLAFETELERRPVRPLAGRR